MSGPGTPILYVIENSFFGGGEQAFAQLINGLDKTKYEVFAACLTGGLNPASVTFTEKIRGSAEIIAFDMRRLISFRGLFLLKKIIREKNISIVHSQGPRADFYSRMAARLAGGAAVVSTVAAPVWEYNVGALRKRVYGFFDELGAGGVDRFIAVAGHIGKKLELKRAASHGRAAVIYNGIDTDKYVPSPTGAAGARARLNIGPDCFLAAAVCRLSWEKGLFSLIEAARLIAADGAADIKYLIAGTGPLEQELKAKVAGSGLGKKFIFTGFVENVRPLLSAADVFVLPSLREGFPVSVLEAMAMAKPVIASDIDGVREAVSDGISGMLVPPRDGAALAGAIKVLYKDRSRAAELGRRGRALAIERFGLDKMIKAHDGLYTGLAG